MGPITVVLRMTGLIMLSPGPGLNAPTYALIPTTPANREHIAQIGYRGPNDHCDTWENGVCYVNIDNWSISLGRSGNPSPVKLPHGNVTDAVHRHVAREHYGETHADGLKARVVLYEGSITDSCALGTFAFGIEGEVRLENLVQWTYTLSTGNALKLERQWMYSTGLGSPQEFAVVPAMRDTVELFLRNIPVDELGQTPGTVKYPKPDTPLPHWRFFYNLLDSTPTTDEVPRFKRPTQQSSCTFVKSRLLNPQGGRNVGTLSCPVGRGDPP